VGTIQRILVVVVLLTLSGCASINMEGFLDRRREPVYSGAVIWGSPIPKDIGSDRNNVSCIRLNHHECVGFQTL
jgi:hypothetical protein